MIRRFRPLAVVVLLLLSLFKAARSFGPLHSTSRRDLSPSFSSQRPHGLFHNHKGREGGFEKTPNQPTGDLLREATGIRPSLHPTTINALALALKLRVNPEKSLMVVDGGATALEVAVRAGQIAADAVDRRQANARHDGMTLTPEEKQTIAGRVVGVVLRFPDLERTLVARVRANAWIAKFGEWDSFGVLPDESDSDVDLARVQQRIQEDPLFAMTRAECLLALFLETVETPSLQKAGQTVPDQGEIDFIDADRKQVLLS